MSEFYNDVLPEGFESQVLSCDKVAIVDFWAKWCGPCVRITPFFEELAEKHNGKVSCFKLNIDEVPQVAMSYGVLSIPTMIMFKDGKEIARLERVSPQTLESFFDVALQS